VTITHDNENLQVRQWNMANVEMSGCAAKINTPWRESDIFNWKRRNCAQSSGGASAGFSTYSIVLEADPSARSSVHTFILNCTSEFFRSLIDFRSSAADQSGYVVADADQSNTIWIPEHVTKDKRYILPMLVFGCSLH
jgi:hypothetical protein